jgi:N-acetylglutamate synthase-like GNAT family acetyltransferase
MANIYYLADYPEYIPHVAQWLYDEWDYLGTDRDINNIIAQLHGNCRKDSLPMTFIMLHEGQPIGTAGLHLYDLGSHAYLPHWLSAVYITPEYRRQGLGKQLTVHATEKAFELGIDALYLATPDKCGWYESFGWEFIETTAYNEQLTVSVMQRRAPSPIILDLQSPPQVEWLHSL